MTDWLPHVQLVRRLAAAGLCDREISEHLSAAIGRKVGKKVINGIRHKYKIKSTYLREYKARKPKSIKLKVNPTSKRKENGITVTVYPPMWAEGARRQFDAR